MHQAQVRKEGREYYLNIVYHLEDKGLQSSFYTFGHSNPATVNALKEICEATESIYAIHISQLLSNCAKISISCSQAIFYANKNCLWESHPLFTLVLLIVAMFMIITVLFVTSILFTSLSITFIIHILSCPQLTDVFTCVRDLTMHVLYVIPCHSCTVLLQGITMVLPPPKSRA